MRKLGLWTAFAAFLASGCSQAIGPSGSAPTAPAQGAIFRFHIAGVVNDSVVSSDYADTIHLTTSGFAAAHSYDSVDRYLIVAANDLDYLLPYDSLILGIYSHGSFSIPERSTPVRYQGNLYTGYVGSDSRYVGDANLFAAGSNYACSRVEMTDHVRFVDTAGISTTVARVVTTLWYAPALHYFVREDRLHYLYDSVIANTVATLTSVKQ